MNLSAADLRKIPHREFRNAEVLGRTPFTGVSMDSRTVKAGELFIALRGERYDGHAFVQAAFAAHAAAVVVDASYSHAANITQPLLIVDDTVRALATLARRYRDKFSIPILAVAGSNGKTTTKDMIAGVLRQRFEVLHTEGNLNNHIGVPRTIFRLDRRHEVAVIEIGTNHPGEIGMLCAALNPTHGVLTNVGREHLEFFHTVGEVAKEEGELFAALRLRANGTAIVNADDARVFALAAGVRKRVSYGFTARRADVRGRAVRMDGNGCAAFEFRGPRMTRWLGVRLAVPGAHNAGNALAAIAAGIAFKVPPQRIKDSLESFRAVSRRMEVISVGEVTILNDTYNANPDSMLAALQTLASMKCPGKKIAVLADMKELGSAAAGAHALVGRKAAKLRLDYVLTYGKLAAEIHKAVARQGAIHYEQKNVLAEYLAELAGPGDTVLIKGSRGMAMEDVVEFLRQRLQTVKVA